MDATPAFFNRVAATYGEAWTIEEETRLGIASMVSAFVRARAPGAGGAPHARVLEVGCGNGRLLCNLAPGAFGVDFAEGMLREARERVPSARLVQASALALPFRPAAFAIVIAANVVHNHADPHPLLREMGRVAENLAIDFRNRANPIVAWRAWRWRSARFIRYTARLPWTWRTELAAAGWILRARRPVTRPCVDPGTGFRWLHLAGAALSRVPGLAPAEVWLCSGACRADSGSGRLKG